MNEIYELFNYCATEYNNSTACHCGINCLNNNYCKQCAKDCYSCIHRVHAYTNNTVHYNCPRLTLFYVLKHGPRFIVEVYLLCKNQIISSFLSNRKQAYITSIGCGPCTELFALMWGWRNLHLNEDDLHYRGFDTDEIWGALIEKVNNIYAGKDIYAYCRNVFDYYRSSEEPIDIIIFNYMLSDAFKFDNSHYTSFLDQLAVLVSERKPSFILINDVYLLDSIGAANSLIRRMTLINPSLKVEKRQYHEVKPYIGQYGVIMSNKPKLKNIPAFLVEYDPFQEVNSIQTIIQFNWA